MKRAVWISGAVALAAMMFGLSLGSRGPVDARRHRPHVATQAEHEPAVSPVPRPPAQLLAAAKGAPPQRRVEALPSPEAPDPAEEDEARRSAAEQAQLARLPLLTAIRGDYTLQQGRYDAMRQALERSGPTNEAWTEQAGEVFAGWNAALGQASGQTEPRGVRCFVAGCEQRVTFRDQEQAERAASAFRSIQEETSTHGGRVQTPAVPSADGRVEVMWMMLRPDLAPPGALVGQ